MGLVLWLPLNGVVINKGFGAWSFTNSDTSAITVNNSGKIGKCYKFSTTSTANSGIYSLDNGFMESYINNKSFTLAAWVNTTSAYTVVMYLSYGLGLFTGNMGVQLTLYNSSRTVNLGASQAINDGKWHHIAASYNVTNNDMKVYIDGILANSGHYTNGYTYASSWVNGLYIGRNPNNNTLNDSYHYKGMMNDVRIYNHALSDKEVKEISKGLIVHYPFDNNSNQIMNNCFSYPTFNTSSANGGWSHWGGTGHIGTYGQNTDTNYIFRAGQTYSHWFKDGEGATYNYLCYQSPEYEGGYRSLCAIIKEENSLPITDNIVYPTWNADDGGTTLNKWTSIESLGNGFYLCKCEGIKQNGSNDLAGLYVRPPYKVYVSECYLENYRPVCSDMFYSSTVVSDTSGYRNDGTINGSFTLDLDTPRYSSCANFSNSGYTLNSDFNINFTEFTVSFWVKPKTAASQHFIFGTFNSWTSNGIGIYRDTSNTIYQCIVRSDAESSFGRVNLNTTANAWNLLTLVFTGTKLRGFINGTLISEGTYGLSGNVVNYNLMVGNSKYNSTPTSENEEAYISDFRIYATALSDNDIKELYNSAASISDNGAALCYEINEE